MVQICDNSKCCTTKELSNTFSSEWKAGKLETWDGGDLGNCSSILFDDKLATVEVSIVKELSKKDALEVTSMVLSAQVGSDKKNIQKSVISKKKKISNCYSFSGLNVEITNSPTKIP